jgi:hypothetical protein
MSKAITKLLLFSILLVALGLLGLNAGALAAPQLQFTPFPTPTPGPDGRIIYIVQQGDSWWRIAAIYNLDLNQLLAMNNATSETIPVPGQEVLLGLGGPAEATQTPGPTATPPSQLPTVSPQPGSGTLCVLVYDDSNGDSLRQEDEISIPGGAISVTDRSGEVSLTKTTEAGLNPYCFEDLPEGDYNITVAVPDGYNPTTVMNYALKLESGSETYLDFGAQANTETLAQVPPSQGNGRSSLLGILGAILLLGGIALGVFAGRLSRTKS